MGLRVMLLRALSLWVCAWMLGGCGASAPPTEEAPPSGDLHAQRTLIAYHLGLLAQRIDTACPEHALGAVLDAGGEPSALAPCAVDVSTEELALLEWLVLLEPGDALLDERVAGLGEPLTLPTELGCDGPDPRELDAALALALALRHRLRDETSDDSVAAITLRALIRQQLTTVLDRKWTRGDLDVLDQARALIPSTSLETTRVQVEAMLERAMVLPDQACLVEDSAEALRPQTPQHRP